MEKKEENELSDSSWTDTLIDREVLCWGLVSSVKVRPRVNRSKTSFLLLQAEMLRHKQAKQQEMIGPVPPTGPFTWLMYGAEQKKRNRVNSRAHTQKETNFLGGEPRKRQLSFFSRPQKYSADVLELQENILTIFFKEATTAAY